MTFASLSKGVRPAIVTLCFALVSVAGAAVPAQSAPATALRFDPAAVQVMSGDALTLALWVDDVEGLDHIELYLDYDWNGLEVQDADPDREGVQIEPGLIFCATCTPLNEASDGRIHFVAQRDPLDGPFSGSGILAYITLRVTATEPDTYTVSFDQAATHLFDSEDHPISVDQSADAALVLSPPQVILTGWLTREGWDSHDHSVVSAVLYPAALPYGPVAWGRTCTDTTGDFTLGTWNDPMFVQAAILPSDTPSDSPSCEFWWAFIRLNFTNYLSECYWECVDGDVRDIGWHNLEGGDVNGDGCVNICDIVLIIRDFDEAVESPCYIPCAGCPLDSPPPNVAPVCDVNGDCQVDILDLSQAAGNFGLCSNCP